MDMKKRILFVGAAMCLAVGATLIGCNNDTDSIANGCKCTATEGGQTVSEKEYTNETVQATGVNTCSAFAAKLVVAAEQQAKAAGTTLDHYTVSCYGR